MTDKFKSWMTNPFFEVVLRSSEEVISNNDLIQDVDINEVDKIMLFYASILSNLGLIILRKKHKISRKNNIITSILLTKRNTS